MHTVRHEEIAIALEHPALWVDGGDNIVRDLVEVMTHPRITADCLRHLVRSREQLIRGHYRLSDGRGCLMFVLTFLWVSGKSAIRAILPAFSVVSAGSREGPVISPPRIRPSISQRSGWCG